MDGGFEGQTIDAIRIDKPNEAKWSVSSTTGVKATIDNTSGKARSGNNCLSYSMAIGGRNVQSPIITPSLTPNTDYIVQFYYNNSTDPGKILNATVYFSATSSSGKVNATTTITPTFTPNTWLKVTAKIKRAESITTNWAGIKDGSSTVAPTGIIDDYVIYQGAVVDVTAPDAATSPSIALNKSTLDIAWKAPKTGVDEGGYMVVRYDAAPHADNDPNPNGIYAIGNTIKNGANNLSGKVVYIGTGTSCQDDNVVNNTNYYYKIYTVDKAFNYSNEVQATFKMPK